MSVLVMVIGCKYKGCWCWVLVLVLGDGVSVVACYGVRVMCWKESFMV